MPAFSGKIISRCTGPIRRWSRGLLRRFLGWSKTSSYAGALAAQLLFDVGLSSFTETVVADLSYGLKRALEIATTLALEPEMMLLDEPTGERSSQSFRTSPRP